LDRTPNPLRPFRAGYWFGGFNGLTWMMTFGTPMVLLLERLGGSTFQVGLITSFIFVLYPVQILATSTLERLGFQRQMVLAWTARAVFLLVPLGVAIHAPETPASWTSSLVVSSVFGFCLFRAFGVAAHVPWFAGILPDEVRGRFFATESAVTSAVGVVALLTCAGLFAALPQYQAFRVVFSIALFGSAMAVWSLLQLPAGDRPLPSPVRDMGREMVRLCLGRGLFRQYLVLAAVGSIVGSSFSSFTIYYLKSEAGLESSRLLTFTASQFAGQIAGTWLMRRWIDRVMIRRFFQLAQLVQLAVFAYWLGIATGEARWLEVVALSYFVVGVALGVANTAHMTFLPELSPVGKRPVSIAVFGAVAGTIQGLGPMMWGLALRSDGALPGVDPTGFTIFFALGIATCATSMWLLRSLSDVRVGFRTNSRTSSQSE
jgi:hypothetical protein